MSRDPNPLVINGINIHSRYNPGKEADKYIRIQLSDTAVPNRIFVLGPGRGYLIESIKRLYPQIRICALFFNKDHYDFIRNHKPGILEDIEYWYPEGLIPIKEFLLNNISETDFTSVKFIEWPPSSQAHPELHQIISKEITAVSKNINSNIITTGGFGRKWIRNSLKNFLHTDSVYTISQFSSPVLIAASGPSLELQKELLKANRSRYILGSLPSTALFMQSNAITPDFYVTTDPGYYAGWHYRYFDGKIPIIRSLNSFFSESILKNKNILCTQNSFIEHKILQTAGVNLPILPSHGTVAGSIGAFVQNNSRSFLAFSGLDFCFSGIKSHVYPHSFDTYLLSISKRTSPLPSLYCKRAIRQAPHRSGNLRTGPALKTYAENFIINNKKQAFRLRPSAINCSSLTNSNWDIFQMTDTAQPLETYSIRWPDLKSRKKVIFYLLNNWRSRIKEYLRNPAKIPLEDLLKDMEIQALLYQLETANLLKIKRNLFLWDETILNTETYAMLERAYEYLNRFNNI